MLIRDHFNAAVGEALDTFGWNEEDHPRDEKGRFGDKGGADAGPGALQPSVPIPDRSDPHSRGQAVDKAVDSLVKQGLDTQSTFDKIDGAKGVYSPERQAAHEQIVNEMLARAVANGAEKGGEAIIMGGLPGAGKTFATRELFDSTRFVSINPDDMKQALVEHGLDQKVAGLGAMETAGLMHEESSDMANLLAERARDEGYNILHDITMGKASSVEDRISKVKDAGYHVTGVFVDVPISLSQQSVIDRYARGLQEEPNFARYVPSEVVKKSEDPTGQFSSINRAVFETEKPRFDNWAMYARDENTPMHLVEASPGTIERLHG